MTEDEFRRTEPEVYQRLQSRYLTQAEMTRERLHPLPYRSTPLTARPAAVRRVASDKAAGFLARAHGLQRRAAHEGATAALPARLLSSGGSRSSTRGGQIGAYRVAAARLRPDLYRRYVDLEQQLGHTMSMGRKPLPQITGIA